MSLMQSEEKSTECVENISDLTADPARFVNRVNKQGLMWFPLTSKYSNKHLFV